MAKPISIPIVIVESGLRDVELPCEVSVRKEEGEGISLDDVEGVFLLGEEGSRKVGEDGLDDLDCCLDLFDAFECINKRWSHWESFS